MKIAIQEFPDSFCTEWIRYCKAHDIDFKLVNCTDSDIITQLEDCSGLMWHWSHLDSRARLFAQQLTFSLEKIGIEVFPDSRTCWHFDDKIAQKYLLECLQAPLVPSYVFYDKHKVMDWVNQTTFPKVFKLRGGAGSVNVKLVRNKAQAQKLIRKAFGKGFRPIDRINLLSDRIMKFKRSMTYSNFLLIAKGLVRFIYPRYDDRMLKREKGYVYFQEFVPENNYDIRVTIIGKRAFGFKRFVRKNDFRASGSGNTIYAQEAIPVECINSAFKMAKELEMQSVCFDFVFNKSKIQLLEISYGIMLEAYLQCPGYWDTDLHWHAGNFMPELFIIEDFIDRINKLSNTQSQ
jgi:hypothetical protein